MKFSVDRIVEGIAVCENDDGEIIRINLSELPEGTEEGSIIVFENGEYSLDTESEEERREELFNLQNMLFGDDE